MSIRSVLVPLLPQQKPTSQLNAALQIARRFGGHLDALLIRPDPGAAFAALPAFAHTDRITLEDIEAAHRRAAALSQGFFDSWCTAALPPPTGMDVAERPSTRWWEQIGAIDDVTAQFGRLSDLIVLGYPSADDPESDRLFTAATFTTGRPVLLVRSEPPADILRHVLVAWDGGLEATRALSGAMPLLAAAKSVTIFTAPPIDGTRTMGLSACEALARHGIQSQQTWSHRNDAAVGDALLRAAFEREASLIVMGARNHSRHLPSRFGGITRHVLHESSLPVLMAH